MSVFTRVIQDQPQTLLRHVFVGCGAGLIGHYSDVGVFLGNLNTTSGSDEVCGMYFDSAGYLYAMCFFAQAAKFNPNFTLNTYPWTGFTGSPSLESVTPLSDGTLLVGAADADVAFNFLWNVRPNGTVISAWAPDVDNRGVDWQDIGADGRTLYYTSESHLIKRFDIVTGTQLADLIDLGNSYVGELFALRVRPNVPDELLVAAGYEVLRIRISTATILQHYTIPAPDSNTAPYVFAVNLDPDGTSFWVVNRYHNIGVTTCPMYRIDIATGATIISFPVTTSTNRVSGIGIYGELH